MTESLERFLTELISICRRHQRPELTIPLAAFATAAFPQVLRLEDDRIAHRSHPLRVLNHLLIALRELPDLSPMFILALAIVALGHDLAAVKKITTGEIASRQPDPRLNERRRIVRLLHEAEGVVELIRAAVAANVILQATGHSPIASDCLELAARVSAVHDSPSLRSALPLSNESWAGRGLAVFAMADGICMIEHDAGLDATFPIGPRVEPWTRQDEPTRDVVAKQARESVKSLRARLQSAFRLAPEVSLPDCFSNDALKGLASRYLAAWSLELREDLDAPAGVKA